MQAGKCLCYTTWGQLTPNRYMHTAQDAHVLCMLCAELLMQPEAGHRLWQAGGLCLAVLVLRSRLREKHVAAVPRQRQGLQQTVLCALQSLGICYVQAPHMLGVFPAPSPFLQQVSRLGSWRAALSRCICRDFAASLRRPEVPNISTPQLTAARPASVLALRPTHLLGSKLPLSFCVLTQPACPHSHAAQAHPLLSVCHAPLSSCARPARPST